jgi:hypothetical protein
MRLGSAVQELLPLERPLSTAPEALTTTGIGSASAWS